MLGKQKKHRLTWRPGISRVALIWLVGCLSLGGWMIADSLRSGGGNLSAASIVGLQSQTHYVTKNIEDIKVGDYVLAKDPDEPGPPTPHAVLALPRNWTDHVVHISVQGGGELQATCSHPFWVEGKGWIYAKDLKPMDELTDEQHRLVLVSNVRVEDQIADTFNLTVEGVHTYYVLAGESPVLVHNVGVIYMVPGSGTPSGLPYIGRTSNFAARQQYSGDGRDRSQAQPIDEYPEDDIQAGRQAEQQAIDEYGGIDNLDNLRNEIAKPCD